jgi:hypothetical protein
MSLVRAVKAKLCGVGDEGVEGVVTLFYRELGVFL